MNADEKKDTNKDAKTYRYKQMCKGLGIHTDTKASTNLADLDKFLENEKITNSGEPWSKLDKTAKIRKLTTFADKYREENELQEDEYKLMIAFFKDCLDKKKLYRVKDVVYDKEIGEIVEIPALFFNKPANHFTLKNIDKRVSTAKGLTAPKKRQCTAKKLKELEEDSDEETIAHDT